MIPSPLLDKARAAARSLAEAEARVETARSEYHGIVRRMHLAGASLREIARSLELSHQRVQQMVGSAGGSWWQRVWRSRRARNGSCSFCGHPQGEVSKLIAGPNVFICDGCVAVAEGDAAELEASRAVKGKARCSFCRKRHSVRAPVVARRGAAICTACLGVCRQILSDAGE